jgi:hypothetical protein
MESTRFTARRDFNNSINGFALAGFRELKAGVSSECAHRALPARAGDERRVLTASAKEHKVRALATF